jgi:hypothetical protein
LRYNTLLLYPDYRFYENGTIVSYKNNIPKQLNPALNSNGYQVVTIKNKYGRRDYKQVHVLIALSFLPNTENKPQVNHKDLNKTNNDISNLEWVTHQENIRHARDAYRKIFNEKYG